MGENYVRTPLFSTHKAGLGFLKKKNILLKHTQNGQCHFSLSLLFYEHPNHIINLCEDSI